MKRIVFSVISCLLLICLTLPGCKAGYEELPLNLEPGGIVTGVDGVSVGAPEGALDQEIGIFIKKVDDPIREVPFPEYLMDVEVVGDFYAISAEQDFSTPDGDYLLLGLPVPEGISTDDLAFVVLVPPDSIIMYKPGDYPLLRWIPLSGVWDPESGLFGTLMPSVLTRPQVFALAVIKVNLIGDIFRVVSIGFTAEECPDEHREMTVDALNRAHAAYVTEMDFREPNLRNHVHIIDFIPHLYYEIDVYGYEYQLVKWDYEPNGFWDPTTRTARTCYRGVPDEPDPFLAYHELFHAIQFAYPALRDNGLGRDPEVRLELHRTMEAAAVAAEGSLDGLTRSNQQVIGRAPLNVTQTLWRSPTPFEMATEFDYAAQDFLVYLGKVIAPADPQLDFMIPWFEQGGLESDLDTVLREDLDPTFNSLGDAYWQWVKNQAFEKQIILGTDWNGVAVPHGDACSWSGHGDLEHVSFSTGTWTWGDTASNFTLGALNSTVFELTLNRGFSKYEVTSTIKSEDPHVKFKFYFSAEAGGQDCWYEARDSVPHTFIVRSRTFVLEEAVTGYLLVSNTNIEKESDLISLVAFARD